MNNLYKSYLIFLSLFFSVLFLQAKEKMNIFNPYPQEKRVQFATSWTAVELNKIGFQSKQLRYDKFKIGNVNEYSLIVLLSGTKQFFQFEKEIKKSILLPEGKEGFHLMEYLPGRYVIAGSDASGILYGCIEWMNRVKAFHRFPLKIDFTDAPQMVLRGSCIGLQKPYYLPGRTVYEYPLTEANFPWFYDKKLWIKTLDSLMINRMNSLYLWNGHPFASLVKVKGYEYAVEVEDSSFKKNEAIYQFITEEAEKRGIWVIQMFYNIIVSKPFAEKHGLKTQDRERPLLPLIADYTRKSIAAFVSKYPHVGLMVCLGEAMEGTGQDDIDWFTKTIIPGVKDGLTALGKTEEPPIVLRAHDTDAPSVMKAALPIYKNLYTEAKFNGEALTTPEPRGAWAELHRTLSGLGSIQIENVHIMANLEPFRYGATGFIQQSVKGMRKIMGGRGLHLYPQASYWDWPYTADSVKKGRLLQIERDWIWYAAWSRYAWNCDRPIEEEKKYWSGLLASKYGCSTSDGEQLLMAYEEMGQIAPKLLRRFGITDGNRQTLTLGMLMNQLIHPQRFGLFTLMYDCESPEGEMLQDYAAKEWKGQAHLGETPVQIIREVRAHASKARLAIQAAASHISQSKEEFGRLENDVKCHEAMALHYAFKAEAALKVLRFQYSHQLEDLKQALTFLEQSMVEYRRLEELTVGTYLYANSMQTQQRKIPMRGVNATYKHWTEVGVALEKELQFFKEKIIKAEQSGTWNSVQRSSLAKGKVRMETPLQLVRLDTAVSLFSDTSVMVTALAPELRGLGAYSISYKDQLQAGTTLKFEADEPVKLLVGYFVSPVNYGLKAPELETNAQANNRGQSEIKIGHALRLKGMPSVNIHSYSFEAGPNSLQLGKGVCFILGFVKDAALEKGYDAGEGDLDEWFDF